MSEIQRQRESRVEGINLKSFRFAVDKLRMLHRANQRIYKHNLAANADFGIWC